MFKRRRGRIQRWVLESGVDFHNAAPDTFEIPSDEDKSLLSVTDHVKLMFRTGDMGERMWVDITGIHDGVLWGTLINYPFQDLGIEYGDPVVFRLEHVIDIWFSNRITYNVEEISNMPEAEQPELLDAMNEAIARAGIDPEFVTEIEVTTDEPFQYTACHIRPVGTQFECWMSTNLEGQWED